MTILLKNFLKSIPKSRLNGHYIKRLPNNINISIPDVDGEALILMLDKYGISASTGSACVSSNTNLSHVLSAIKFSSKFANNTLRMTLGRSTNKNDINYVLKILSKIIKKYSG